jgi:hypothetical protein
MVAAERSELHPLPFPNQDRCLLSTHLYLPRHSIFPAQHVIFPPWVEQDKRHPFTWNSSERGWWIVRITMRPLRANCVRRTMIWFAVMQSRPVVGSSNIMTSASEEGADGWATAQRALCLTLRILTSPLLSHPTPSNSGWGEVAACKLAFGLSPGKRTGGSNSQL